MNRLNTRTESRRDRGAAMILVVIASIALMAFAAIMVQGVMARSSVTFTQRLAFSAHQIAESGAAQAMAKLKFGGLTSPYSGSGSGASWEDFSTGQFYYYTTTDATTGAIVLRAWGRVAATDSPSNSTVAPDDGSWNGDGWLVRGIEVSVRSYRYFPESPVFVGNGGIEKPIGGFDWTGGSDPFAPETWATVTSGNSSYQDSDVPMEVSSLDHPHTFLESGGSPAPATVFPHPYNIWVSQNPIGQFNVSAWFENSAGGSSDPTVNVTPPVASPYYEMTDSSSADYPYSVDPKVPDVQSYSWALWSTYQNDSSATLLTEGSLSGIYGTLASPSVTFVTGKLTVNSGDTFKGAGILVIRDDYDPNTDTDNRPSVRASLYVAGTLEWEGLVIVSGWAPAIEVADGGDMTVLGALFGEDSVQSGGETSLDSATITFIIRDRLRILYSSSMFQSGGMIYDLMPRVGREVIGIREI